MSELDAATSAVRIAHVIHGLRPGGAERRLLAVLAGLHPTRFESLIVCTDELGELADDARAIGVEPVLLGRGRRPASRDVLRLARLLRRERAAVVHGWLSMPSAFARTAGAIARVPVRIAAPGGPVETIDPRRAHRYARAERVLSHVTDAYIANSETVAGSLQGRGISAEKIVVIPNGVAVPVLLGEEERARLRAGLGAHADTELIGMTARLDPGFKDHETLLRSVAALADDGRAVQAAIVGDGPGRPGIERLASDLGIADRVTFAGFRDDAARLVGVFDISVLLTYSEGFSNVVLETMAAGVPLVTTDIPANREAIEDGAHGMLVPVRDVGATVAALRRLLDDEDLAARIGEAARQRARERFSLEAQAERTMQLYDDLLGRKVARV
jgi:L-malate glycosyltransferase